MEKSLQAPALISPTLRVAAGEDRFGEHRGLGISAIDFKVVPQDSNGLLIIENTLCRRRTRSCGATMGWSYLGRRWR